MPSRAAPPCDRAPGKARNFPTTGRLNAHDARLDALERGDTERQKRNDQRIADLERARWPLPSLAALVGVISLAVALWQAAQTQTNKTNPADPDECGDVPGGTARSVVNNTDFDRNFFRLHKCSEPIAGVDAYDSNPDLGDLARSWR
ncbi:hypothetical protein AB0E67_08190 [Streptomyces sp. NPDC032161]|uniref:hypothetical protein n=1 Tax=unclassified Streptomyces TaxID=2593676 RepID=UPI00340903B6